MDRNLALEVVRVPEAAALAAARLMGRGDPDAVDQTAREAFARAFRAIETCARVVVGEASDGEAEHLGQGELLGALCSAGEPRVDLALDALEGDTICALGGNNALSIVLLAERGCIHPCPPTYMDKLATGPEGRGVVDLDLSPSENLQRLAQARGVYVEDLTVAILERPRHARLIDEVRRAGARVQLLADGDLAVAIATARPESGIDILMGTGGARQGILAAGALGGLGGEFQGRFRPLTRDDGARMEAEGIADLDRKLGIADLVGETTMFAATGVTNGHLLSGVRFFGGGARTNSMVVRSSTRTVRWIEAVHHFDRKPEY